MVPGLKMKNRKSPYIQLDYIINLIEIKPWPPSQSLRSLRSALIQWQHGDKASGSTKTVAPSTVSNKIEFNESFRIHVTLARDMSIKTGENEIFLRNCIEFNLYEPRRDRTVKGKLLASGVIDFAEYGIVGESLMIGVPMNCKRAIGNSAQPMLFIKIHTVEKGNCEKNRFESVSALMKEEYAEEAETGSITDDDISSQSSMAANSSSTFGSNGNVTPQKENGFEAICGSSGKLNDQAVLTQDTMATGSFNEERILSSSSSSSSSELYSQKLQNTHSTSSNFHNSRSTIPTEKTQSFSLKPSKLSVRDLNASQSVQESQIIGDVGSDADVLNNLKPLGSSSDSEFRKILKKFKNVGVQDQNNEKKLTDNERKVQRLKQRVQILEGELREAAGIEVSLYSVVAEHGSSVNKVHAPARRLSRLYRHGFKENPRSMRASSARSIVSGLILVAKACGNDVPRLTFWLSNTIVLRAIIYKTNPGIVEKGNQEVISPFRSKKESNLKESRSSNEWDDVHIVTSALEKVESWIFSRIIESVWWQTLAPYMQSTAVKSMSRSVESESYISCQTPSDSRDEEHVKDSLELWKSAFMDVYERICPNRAAGHDCGCLPVMLKLIMEQLIARLDVAMFNAILRESSDEVPMDPVSDPISDASVLPISPGKASFGAGAQLKKTIGNWSRWLTNLLESEPDCDASFNSFRFLNPLSELMMLPKDMLLSNTIRKQVCPAFGVPLIKRILDSFIPDEFCPEPIPEVVLEALDSEDLIESDKDCVTSLPCSAPPITYHPPASECILEDSGSQDNLPRNKSSILRKSNTSDDELDELYSPMTSIIDSSQTLTASTKPMWPLKDAGNGNMIRYQLLRDVWMNSE